MEREKNILSIEDDVSKLEQSRNLYRLCCVIKTVLTLYRKGPMNWSSESVWNSKISPDYSGLQYNDKLRYSL